MLRSAALLGVMLRSQVLAAGFGRPAGSLGAATPLARAASRLAGHPGRPSGSETLPQRTQQRGLHRGCTAMAQRYDRSRRYDVVPTPGTKPAAPRPSAPPAPAPSPLAAPRAPAVAPPVQRRAPQPSAPPAAQQQQQQPFPAAAGREEPSVDYGVLMRPDSRRMVLVDALPLLYKAHFAFPPDARLRSTAGADTTVVYVFLNMLLNLLNLAPPPTHFAVVFDASGKTFRHELYSDYKGQRPDMPDEIRQAIPEVLVLLEAMRIPVFSIAGVEADDVLGTLAVRGVQEGMVVAIASPDKDFFQLLRMGLILLRPPKKQQYHHPPGEDAAAGAGGAAAAAAGAGRGGQPGAAGGERRVSKFMLLPYTEADFKDEWGLDPPQFTDLLALAGDASDNVPGVAGVGPKTAATLLRQHGSLDSLLEQAGRGEVPKKVGATLASAEGAAAARLSRQLVRIETALDIPTLKFPLEELRLRLPEDGGQAMLAHCQQLDFKTHVDRLRKLWAGPAYQAGGSRAGKQQQ